MGTDLLKRDELSMKASKKQVKRYALIIYNRLKMNSFIVAS